MTVPGSVVTMDEIGEQLEAAKAAGKATDLAAVKLEGDTVPEAVRGKTVADILREREVLEQSLRIANDARKAAEDAAKGSAPAPVVIQQPPPTPGIQKKTKEELAALFESDPIEAVAYMQAIADQDAEARIERRFSSLSTGAASSAESAARAKFKDEFELFGNDIKQLTAGMPDKSVLTNIEAWDHLVSYIRGRPGNFEKLMDLRVKKSAEAAAEAARLAQEQGTGANFSTTTARPAAPASKPSSGSDGNYGLDAEERHAADVMGMEYKDYAYYKKIGG